MEGKIVRFNVNDINEAARAEFRKTAGFEDGNKKHQRMAAQAEDILQDCTKDIQPTAIYAAYGPEVLQGDTAVLDGITIKCNAFARLDPARVVKLYPYILTAGDIPFDNDNTLHMLFADMWGTAYTDAAVEALKEHLAKDAQNASGAAGVSSFGPGYFGMEMNSIQQFFDLLDGGAIGVEVRSNCYMIPQKSCCGFMVAVQDAAALPPGDCENCIGGKGGCQFCRNNPTKAG